MNENFTIGSYLKGLENDIDEVVEDSRRSFSHLTEDQFNWKPNSNEWSVAQCFEHMRMNGISILPALEKALRENTPSEDCAEKSYKHGFLGKRAIRIISPESTRKFKTTKNFSPEMSNYRLSAIEDFVSLQETLKNCVTRSSSYNIEKIMVAMPAFRIFRLRMGDMLKFVIAHEQRHVKQAKLVMGMKGFPD